MVVLGHDRQHQLPLKYTAGVRYACRGLEAWQAALSGRRAGHLRVTIDNEGHAIAQVFVHLQHELSTNALPR